MVQIAALRRNELRDWVGMPPDEDMNEIIKIGKLSSTKRFRKSKKLKGGENDDE